MKRLLLFVFVVNLTLVAQAQYEYFVGGHVGGIMPTILNQDAWGAQEYEYLFSPQPEFGVDLSVFHDEEMQFSIGFWKTVLGQAYTSNYNNQDWKRHVWSDYFLVPFTVRKILRRGNKLDWSGAIGFLWAIRQNAEQEWTLNGEAITKEQDYSIWHKPYWISDPKVDDRYVKNDYMLYLDLGVRRHLSTDIYIDILAYGALGVRDINEELWRIENKSKKYGASHNVFGGIKLCVGFKFAQTGRFFLLDKVNLF